MGFFERFRKAKADPKVWFALANTSEDPILHHLHDVKDDNSLHAGEPFNKESLCGANITTDICYVTSFERLISFTSVEDEEEFLICDSCISLYSPMAPAVS